MDSPESSLTDSQKALFVAIEKQDIVTVEELLNNGADPNCKDRIANGNTPLITAVKRNNDDVITALIQHGANVNWTNDKRKYPLTYAVERGNVDVVGQLLGCGSDVNLQDTQGQCALSIAVSHGHTHIVEILLASGSCDVNLHNKWGQAALHVACKKGHLGDCTLLVFHGADVNTKDRWLNTPLMYATLHGHSNIVWFLVTQAKCSVNAVNMGWRTALHTAAQNGQPAIVKVLLEFCADINLKDSEGNTPLLLAGKYQHHGIFLSLLTAEQADVNHVDKSGRNALHFSALNGHIDALDWLLEHGLDPDVQDKKTNTPLVLAVCRNRVAAVHRLLQRNCSVMRHFHISGRPQPLLALTLRNGYRELAQILILAGCDTSCFHTWLLAGLISHIFMEDEDFLCWLRVTLSNPFSLKEICRCNIRSWLTNNIQRELDELPLPVSLKEYILMKNVLAEIPFPDSSLGFVERF